MSHGCPRPTPYMTLFKPAGLSRILVFSEVIYKRKKTLLCCFFFFLLICFFSVISG